ncbi:MAG: hypothetical protein ABI400_12145 [Lacisediminihabitans sp.]
MTIHNTAQQSEARRPSQKVRIAAAQLRVESDRQVKRQTPQWIKDLAESGQKK